MIKDLLLDDRCRCRCSMRKESKTITKQGNIYSMLNKVSEESMDIEMDILTYFNCLQLRERVSGKRIGKCR